MLCSGADDARVNLYEMRSLTQVAAMEGHASWVLDCAFSPDGGVLASGGADKATAAPGVTEAIDGADIVLIAPSNPVVSIGPILGVGGVRAALRTTPAPVIGYSPIVAGKPLRGMADTCLNLIGVGTTSEAVGAHYGARSSTGILDGWLIHEGDHATVPGVDVRAVPLLMTEPAVTAEMVRAGMELAGVAP